VLAQKPTILNSNADSLTQQKSHTMRARGNKGQKHKIGAFIRVNSINSPHNARRKTKSNNQIVRSIQRSTTLTVEKIIRIVPFGAVGALFFAFFILIKEFEKGGN
jgi:hypothetical protein